MIHVRLCSLVWKNEKTHWIKKQKQKHIHESKRKTQEAYGRLSHLVWQKFLPHHIPGSPNSEKIHRNNREKKSRHKERYNVSTAPRITAIFTTEKLTYSTVLYGTTGVRQQKENTEEAVLASVMTGIYTETRFFPLVLGPQLSYTLHRSMHPSINAAFELNEAYFSQ